MAYTKEQRAAKAKAAASKAASAAETVVAVPQETEGVPAKIEEPVQAASSPAIVKAKESEYGLHDLVPVMNGTQHLLVYISSQTKETYEWESFGDVNYIALSELITMKRTQRTFFVKNWILIEDRGILDYLQVSQYYSDKIDNENIDQIYNQTPEQIISTVSGLRDGLKETIRQRTQEMIKSGKLDSLKRITALEQALGSKFDI